MRKSWKVVPKAGSIDNLKIVEEPIPELGPDDVEVDVKAFGLNFADIFAVFGLYSATPPGSFTPGLEFSGTVKAVGENVKTFRAGDRVMGVTRFGGYTTTIVSPDKYLVSLPNDWSFEEGAAYLVQVFTAYYALVDLGNIKKGSTVLVQSAAGGVGIWAGRIAKHFNAYTIGTVGNSSKVELLKKEGYDQAIVRDENYAQNLKNALGGRELNIVLDSIGGEIMTESFRQMAMEGRLVVYGSARYAHPGRKPNKLKLLWKFLKRPKIDPQKLIEDNKSVMGFNLIYLFTHSEKMVQIITELDVMKLDKPIVGHQFKFEDVKNALELFLSGQTTGKVVITP